MLRKRNDTLQIFKLIASYMVVFIHIYFYGKVGIIADALARFAVPFFFLISGFYSYGCTPEKIKKRIKHIFGLILFAIIAYTAYDISLMLLQDNYGGIVTYFKAYFLPQRWHGLLLFNLPIYKTHLWYLFAILWVYIIYFFALRFNLPQNLLYIVGFVLLIVHLTLGELLSAFKTVLLIHYVRNWALMGLPFFLIGLLVYKHREKLANIPNLFSLTLLVLGIATTLLSRTYIGKNELYLGSLFILFAVITLSIKYADKQYPKALVKIAGCSTYIYIFHVMIISATQILYGVLNINAYTPVWQMIQPLIICLLSTIFAFFLNEITSKTKKKPITK